MLPNFIIFGTRKAGTTSLYNYLYQHPQIFMSGLKGTKYFLYDPDKPEDGASIPVKTLAQYESMFDGAKIKGAKVIGEATPSYMSNKGVAGRIKATLPKVKLLTSLRNPVDRTYSHYLMNKKYKTGGRNLSLTLDNVHTWSDAGLYYEALKEYYDLFPRDQIKVMIFEDWIRDPNAAIKDLYKFLSVDEEFTPDLTTQYNKGGIPRNELVSTILKHRPIYITLKPYVPPVFKKWVNKVRGYNMKSAPPLDESVRNYLQEYFKRDQENLERLIGRDLSVWQKN